MRCAKINRVTNRHTVDLKCTKCQGHHDNEEDHREKLLDDVETMAEFSYIGDIIKSGGGCEVNAKICFAKRNFL